MMGLKLGGAGSSPVFRPMDCLKVVHFRRIMRSFGEILVGSQGRVECWDLTRIMTQPGMWFGVSSHKKT